MPAGTGPGGPLTFFASPKKVSKERRPCTAAPFGGSQKSGRKIGKRRNSPSAQTSALLYPILRPLFWRRHKGEKRKPIPTLALPLKGRELKASLRTIAIVCQDQTIPSPSRGGCIDRRHGEHVFGDMVDRLMNHFSCRFAVAIVCSRRSMVAT